MSNGNAVVIQEMRKIVAEGKKIDIDTRDRLLFAAIIDIYEQLSKFAPALIFYQVGIFFMSAIGLAILGFVGLLLTNRIDLVLK